MVFLIFPALIRQSQNTDLRIGIIDTVVSFEWLRWRRHEDQFLDILRIVRSSDTTRLNEIVWIYSLGSRHWTHFTWDVYTSALLLFLLHELESFNQPGIVIFSGWFRQQVEIGLWQSQTWGKLVNLDWVLNWSLGHIIILRISIFTQLSLLKLLSQFLHRFMIEAWFLTFKAFSFFIYSSLRASFLLTPLLK